MKKGKLIVIEGVDGSGKTTQFEKLVDRLKRTDRKVRNIHFPRHQTPFFGTMVDDYLNGRFGDPDAINPYLSSLIYAGDRWEAKDAMHQWLGEGAIIVLDRYMTSNKGHQLGKIQGDKEREKYLQWLDCLEYDIFKIPRPDLVIYLHIPLAIVDRLMNQRKDVTRGYTNKNRDLLENNQEHLRRAQDGYQFTAPRYSYWRQLNCVKEKNKLLTREEIHERIWQLVMPLLQ